MRQGRRARSQIAAASGCEGARELELPTFAHACTRVNATAAAKVARRAKSLDGWPAHIRCSKRARFTRSDRDLDRPISAFERAVALSDGLIYDEPEPLPFSPQHGLARRGSRPNGTARQNAYIARTSTNILTTAARSLDSRPHSSRRENA